jgi:hypothetical protein
VRLCLHLANKLFNFLRLVAGALKRGVYWGEALL